MSAVLSFLLLVACATQFNSSLVVTLTCDPSVLPLDTSCIFLDSILLKSSNHFRQLQTPCCSGVFFPQIVIKTLFQPHYFCASARQFHRRVVSSS